MLPLAGDNEDEIRARLLSLREGELGDLSYGRIGEPMGMNHETVRRIFQGGGTPTAKFLTGLWRTFGVSPLWLLSGTGPRRWDEVPNWLLQFSSTEQILSALSRRMAANEELLHELARTAGESGSATANSISNQQRKSLFSRATITHPKNSSSYSGAHDPKE